MMTKCQDCAFKIEVDGVQTGCLDNRIEKLQKIEKITGIKEVEFTGKSYILDRFCTLARPVSFGKENLAQAKKEIQITFSSTIFYKDGKDINLTIKSLIQQTLRPLTIIILVKVDDFEDSIKSVRDKVTADIDWSIVPKEITVSYYVEDERVPAIVQELSKIYNPFYFTFSEAGTEIPNDVFEKIDVDINENLGQKVLYVATAYNLMVMLPGLTEKFKLPLKELPKLIELEEYKDYITTL